MGPGPAARSALAVAATLALVAGSAGGHGATTEEVRQAGDLKVTFFAFSYTTPHETIRPAWKVLDAAGHGVAMNGTVLNVTDAAEGGPARGSYDQALTETTTGFVYTDLVTGARGWLRFRLPLPGQAAETFQQAVCDVDAQGQLTCPGDKPAPGAGAGVVLAAAGAAAVLAARRRG